MRSTRFAVEDRFDLRRSLPIAVLVAAALLGAQRGAAQPQRPPQKDMTIDGAMRREVLDGVAASVKEAYVFPDVAKKIEAALRRREKRGEYAHLSSAIAFAESLTAHVRDVAHDKHLHVDYFFEPIPTGNDSGPSPAELEEFRRHAASRNFGFREVKRLDGNVGYLALDGFMPPSVSGETAAAAMGFLANCDALIIDLRQNGGGSPEGVALVSTYLFEGPPVHLNDLYSRPDNETRQFWTLPYVPGKRLAGKEVYVLTSRRTFSGAEEFAYNLKNLKRATLVGETTGGGAHPGGPRRINDYFAVWVPSGRAINPISKTNWEGTGVEPDVKTTAEAALRTAHLAALRRLAESKPADPQTAREIESAISRLESEEAGLSKAD